VSDVIFIESSRLSLSSRLFNGDTRLLGPITTVCTLHCSSYTLSHHGRTQGSAHIDNLYLQAAGGNN